MRDGLWMGPCGFPSKRGVWRNVSIVLLSLAGCLLLAGCAFPGSVKPTIKIGLSAPFEGRYRDEGYEALHAVRLAVRQRNEAGGIGASYWVELVALNDFDEPAEAVVQANKMAVDSDLMGVLGGWSLDTAVAARPEYERLGLAFLTPMAVPEGCQVSQADPAFTDAYMALSGGAPPASIAGWAYGATNCLLDALDAAARAEGRPTRSGVKMALWGKPAQ
jgi:ABC-type branched-subunit amino acid transport system substrate-binding protein